MVPGPTSVSACCLEQYSRQYGSSDLESAFVALYERTQAQLLQILGGVHDNNDSAHTIVLQTGEAMVCLWGALKSVIRPGDKVLAVATGLFGYGIGDMAKECGADVRVVGVEYDECIDDELVARVAAEASAFAPMLITAVHCETPSGVLNPLAAIRRVARNVGALLYVDFVSSGGACPVDIAANGIDLGLLGSQKALSLPPDMGIVTVSDRAWQRVAEVGYAGYDALKPYRTAVEHSYFPYTPHWRGVAALHCRCTTLLAEGMDSVYARHASVAAACRQRVRALGLRLYPKSEASSAPSVTAVCVPDGWTWSELDTALRTHGVVFGGSYGPLAGKVFRIGHMGNQADMTLLTTCMDALALVLTIKHTHTRT